MGNFYMSIRTLVALNLCICLSIGQVLNNLGGFHERKRGGMRNRGADVSFIETDSLPEVTVASMSDNIVLECKAGGSSPTIHWLKDGLRIQQGTDRDYMNDEAAAEERSNVMTTGLLKLGLTKSKLYLDCVTQDTAGEYTCVAETPRKRITQSTVVVVDDGFTESTSHANCIAKRSSIRNEPARIFLWTSHRIEIEGAYVQLFCRAEGYPKPDVMWFDRNGVQITADNADYQIMENGDLIINSISWNKMGSYICKSSNELATDQVSIFLYPAANPRRRNGK